MRSGPLRIKAFHAVVFARGVVSAGMQPAVKSS
jgi:hypothetical protein